jgi:cysteine desulfurase
MIYADHNSTTACSSRVTAKMIPYLGESFGNPSSSHQLGQEAGAAIEQARQEVAKLLGAKPNEVLFTSGGTESCTQALFGAHLAQKSKTPICTSAIEHVAVHHAVAALSRFTELEHFKVAVDSAGVLSLNELEQKLESGARIVSIMYANNETGVISPMKDVSSLCQRYSAFLHTDSVQALGKVAISFDAEGVDAMSVSAHKIGGPKGVGALIVREGSLWEPYVTGGGQEQGRRGGTQAVALIVGFGEAARELSEKLERGEIERQRKIRESFEDQLLSSVSDVTINGGTTERLANTSSICISGVSAHDVLAGLSEKEMYCSAGSACKSSSMSPSHVLSAMGLSLLECLGTIRVSFGGTNSVEDAQSLVEAIKEEVDMLRDKQAKSLDSMMKQGLGN